MTDVADDIARPRLLALLFLTIGALMLADMADDLRARIDRWHLLLEGGVVVLSAAGIGALARDAARARREARRLGRDLGLAQADAARWRDEAREALRGFGAAIGRQLERWDLTGAERDIALQLVRGRSHKEIAAARATTERTVRQQALTVYRKAGVHTRAELAAFFLRDLPGPAEGGGA